MSIKSKREVVSSLSCHTRIIGGKPREIWEAYFGTDGHGRKIRCCKSSKKDALMAIDDFFRKYKDCGDSITILKPAQIYDAQTAFSMLSESGFDMTLTEAVRRFVEASSKTRLITDKLLGAAYDEYHASIPDIQHHHKYAIKMRVGKWVQDFGPDKSCSEVTSKKVAAYLTNVGKRSDKTYNNHLNYIKSFLEWCAKSERSYISESPLADMSSRKMAYKEPEYMKVADFEKMIRHFEGKGDKRALTIIILSFFCGIRTDEIMRVLDDPKQINIGEETVRIAMPKGWSQGMIPRAVHIPANAMEWLKTYELQTVFGTFNSRNERTVMFGEAKKKLGLKIPNNVGRHTFITMHVAAYGQPNVTEAMAGTSKEMRAAHYMGLASKREGERFFGIVPVEGKKTK